MDPEEFTEEEQAAYDSLQLDNTPPPDEDDAQPGADAVAPVANPVPAEPAAPAPAPAEGGEPDAEKFEAFKKLHEGKSADELLTLFFQQERRANRSSYDARQATERLQSIVTRARQTLEQKTSEIQARREAFQRQLEEDPDAATRALAESRFTEEEEAARAEVERAEREARIESAFGLAMAAIPDLPNKIGGIYQFGSEMNFSKDELEAIDDGRQLVTLWLASLAGNLIRGQMMDLQGNLIAAPPAVAATDPRLSMPNAPRTLTAAPSRPANATKTVEEQINDLLAMSDADFGKLSVEELKRLTG